MPVGVLINTFSIIVGGLSGWLIARCIPKHISELFPVILGVCSFAIGIVSVVKMQALPAVILSVIMGTVIGEIIGIEKKVTAFFGWVLDKFITKDREFNMELYITAVALFCISGLGIFGVLTEGVSGDSSILITKSVLDFFTSILFASTLGVAVSLIAVPQLIIFFILFLFSRSIVPLINPAMIADFTACGGLLAIAAGLRISRIKQIPIMSMLPALMLVMPVSYLWDLLMKILQR